MWYFLEGGEEGFERKRTMGLQRHGVSSYIMLHVSLTEWTSQSVWDVILPQGGSVCDGQQRDARVLSSLENLSLHVNAHSAGTLIQQSILGPDGGKLFSSFLSIQWVTNETGYVGY